MKRRLVQSFILCFLLSNTAAVAAAASPQITLKWGVGQGGKFVELYEYIARKFEEQHPNVKVEIIQAGYDALREKVVVAHAGGAPIDIFEAHSQYLAELTDTGIIADLNPLLAADPEVKLRDFIPVTVSGNRWKGKQVGLAVAAFMDVLYFNRKHFDEIGLAYPARPRGCSPDSCPQAWDWPTFAGALQKLTRDLNGDGKADQVGLLLTAGWGRVMPFVFQAGGSLFNGPYTAAVIDSDAAVETLTFFQDLQARGALTGGGFFQGTTSMYVSGPWDLPPAITSGIDFDIGMLPRHRHFGTRASSLPIHMSSITPHRQEAWQLIKFIISPEVQRQLIKSVGWAVPAHIPSAQEYIRQPGPPQSKHVFFEQVIADPGHQVLSHPRMPQIIPVLQGAFNTIWQGKAAARPALTEANRQINALMGQ